jgi:internalin A
MSPEENADYLEALRRIREAEETGATKLDLSFLQFLEQLPRELGRLTSLQTLNLSGTFSRRMQLRDVTPLARLTSLQTLNLSWCKQISDVTVLSGLTSLQTLNLSGCEQISDVTR